MSQEILPKSKNTHLKSYVFQKTFSQIQNTQVNLTKVLNPLLKCPSNKNSLHNTENDSTKYSTFHSRKQSNMKTQNNNYLNVKAASKQQKLKNPQFHFYRADLNSSSDAFFMNNSFQDCKDQIEQKITQKFNLSKNQIQDLIQKSPSKNNKRQDKKLIKRQKLEFYHCDQIIIRPAPSIKAVKVFDLAIRPTKNTKDQSCKNYIIESGSHQYVQKPFLSGLSDASGKKNYDKKLLDLINESPLQNSKNYHAHEFIMDSPSFFDTVDEERKTSKSAKQINTKSFKDGDHTNLRKELNQKEQNLETKSNKSEESKGSNAKLVTNSLEKRAIRNEENMEENLAVLPLRKRNKIFGDDKKYGLKLSRAIKHETEIEMLRGELGVDVFHIIFEQDQLFRQCCT